MHCIGFFSLFLLGSPPDTCLSMCCVVVNINWHYLFHLGFTVSAGRGGGPGPLPEEATIEI